MGRAMLIIVTGLLVALGYTFMGMSNQRQALNNQSVQKANKVLAENLAHTGLQLAIEEYDQNGKWDDEKSQPLENGTVVYTVQDSSGIIEISSTGNINGGSGTHTIVATYEIQSSENVIPEFKSALSLTNNNFTIDKMGGAMSISGEKAGCSSKPGITVKDDDSKEYIEENAGNGGGGGKGKGKGKGGGNKKGISGNPPVAVDGDLSYSPFDETVARLIKRGTQVTDKSDISQSNPSNPGVFVLDSGAQLNGNVTGYGVLIIRNGGRINGNFQFNGLVIFEDEDVILGNGTADLNGSVIVGSTTEDSDDEEDGKPPVEISLNGNIGLQYDCTTKQYADLAAEKVLDKTYRLVSMHN